MKEFSSRIVETDDIENVLEVVAEAGLRHGAKRHTYHLTPRFESQTGARVVVASSGYSPDLVALYEDPKFRATDPIPAYVMRRGRTMRWQDVIADLREMGEGHEEYFSTMSRHGLRHGLAIPLFGPGQRDAYASFGFDEGQPLEDPSVIVSLTAIMQIANRRISRIVDAIEEKPQLPHREQSVLEGIAHGKSNIEIARDLGISAETVATYVKRLFAKLEARNRVAATVKAMKLGLIDV